MKVIIYTHSEYSYVWPLCFHQTSKFLNKYEKIVFCNSTIPYVNYSTILYDSKDSYKDRLISCLNKLDKNCVVLFFHEDMFLYDIPKYDYLLKYENYINNNSADCIKLIRSSPTLQPSFLDTSLFKNHIDQKFSIQPTLVKVSKFLEILNSSTGSTIWELENSMFTNPLINDDKSFFCYNGEPKRGIHHYDSFIFPYMATAIIKGNWNFLEYSKELHSMFNKLKSTNLICFDLDGVLVDACELHYEALNKALRELSTTEISRDEHLSFFNALPTKKKLEKLAENNRICYTQIDSISNRKQELTLSTINSTIYPDQTKIELLDYLKSKKIKLACVTNSVRATAISILKKSDILDYFDIIISNEDVKIPKPNPEGYIKAMNLIGVSPKSTIIVEDSEHGYNAALGSGAKVIKVLNQTEVTIKLFEGIL